MAVGHIRRWLHLLGKRAARAAGLTPAPGAMRKTISLSHMHLRVSYSGYYAAFPRLRGEFDSLYPHHILGSII